MTPERRDELVRRRQQLIDERRQRPIDEARQEFLATLDAAKVPYRTIDTEQASDWMSRNFTFDNWGNLDWTKAVELDRMQEGVMSEQAWITEVAGRFHVGNRRVWVVYQSGPLPSLSLRYKAFAAHADVLVDNSWHTWVFDPESNWVIEFHFTHGWTFGTTDDRGYAQLSALLDEREQAGQPTLITMDCGRVYRAEKIEWGIDDEGWYFNVPGTNLVDEFAPPEELKRTLGGGRIDEIDRVTDAASGDVIYQRYGPRREE